MIRFYPSGYSRQELYLLKQLLQNARASIDIPVLANNKNVKTDLDNVIVFIAGIIEGRES